MTSTSTLAGIAATDRAIATFTLEGTEVVKGKPYNREFEDINGTEFLQNNGNWAALLKQQI